MVRVRFARSDKEVEWDPTYESLLRFAEAHDVFVDHCCVSGIDGICSTPLLSGEIAYLEEPYYDPESGHVLLCVATPKTDIVLDA